VQDATALFDAAQAGGLILNQVAVAGHDQYYGYGAYGQYGAGGPDTHET
jgi:hypothetical protein